MRFPVALPLLLATAVAGAACAPASSPAPPPPAELRAELERQFERSAVAWNAGDLAAFMDDYARDSLTSFMGARAPVYGWETIRDRYAPSFQPGARRDSLRFERFAVRPLSPSLALVTARYILHRGDSVTSSGPFTLVMERRPDGWKILHDHTSPDPR
ncbi:MAG TPA: nuclear transport factor 2 family protein [Gemmatimonadales bacterium]|nr:nuclear transport factor 2 family protein [Gemmatimonadales bacterium]